MTGLSAGGADAVTCGLADALVDSQDIPGLIPRLFDSELDQVSDALDALTEGIGDAMYVQNMSTGPDPGSDRAL